MVSFAQISLFCVALQIRNLAYFLLAIPILILQIKNVPFESKYYFITGCSR